MPIRITEIDEAITAHLLWLTTFQNSLEQRTATTAVASQTVRDPMACTLGHWMNSTSAKTLLGPDLLGTLQVIHETFHEVSYLVALMLETNIHGEEIHGLMSGLNNLSSQIVSILTLAKSKFANTEATA